MAKSTEENINLSDNLSSLNYNGKTNEQILVYLKELSGNINNVIKLLESISPKNNLALPTETEKVIDASLCESTLIISDSEGKVVLPYTICELDEILNSNTNYSSFEEIIDNLYTIPLKYYKSTSIARFKEAFKLVKEREGGSLKDAIDLGLELFSNYSLHPAVITACKNLNELDVYLSCLEYNELEDFHFFKIEFKALPMVKSKINLFKKTPKVKPATKLDNVKKESKSKTKSKLITPKKKKETVQEEKPLNVAKSENISISKKPKSKKKKKK